MYSLYVPDNYEKIIAYFYLNKIRKIYKDIIKLIISFIPVNFKFKSINELKNLNLFLSLKHKKFHFIRDYYKKKITYSKPKVINNLESLDAYLRGIDGKSYFVQMNNNETWLYIKKKIQKEYNIPVKKQIIIVCGIKTYNNQIININFVKSICCVYLVIDS